MTARVKVSEGARTALIDLGWDDAVAEILARGRLELALEGDAWELYCEDGTTMQNKLTRSLGELRDRRICPRLEFELRPVPQPPAG